MPLIASVPQTKLKTGQFRPRTGYEQDTYVLQARENVSSIYDSLSPVSPSTMSFITASKVLALNVSSTNFVSVEKTLIVTVS